MRWPADFSGDPEFRRTPAQQRRFDDLLDSADVLYGIPDVDPAALARTVRANPRLRWVQAMAAGAGSQLRAANLQPHELARIKVTTGAGVHAGPLSEFALFGLLCGAKVLPRLQSDQRGHHWPGRWPMKQLTDQTIVIVGLGYIGREIARKLASLGSTVIAVNRTSRTLPYVRDVLPMSELSVAVQRADAVVNTMPGSAETDGLISAPVFAAMRPDTTFVSVGRGTVVDEQALIAAVHNGQVGFAALDVFATEPLSVTSPLWDMPQVLVSPHTAANSRSEQSLLAELFCENFQKFRGSAALRNQIARDTFT